MGLIDYTNLEDGTPITANIFNERFGQIIAVLNGGLDQNNFSDAGIPTVALSPDVFEQIYPIGSLYFNSTDNTNPATLLGFGTWVAFGAGRVPVGYDGSDSDFNAAEKTGGSKTVSLTVGQLPAHNHTGNTNNNGSHSHSTTSQVAIKTSSTVGLRTQYNDAFSWGNVGTTTNGDHNHSFTTNNTGSGEGHPNLQPFVTVYIWKRTA